LNLDDPLGVQLAQRLSGKLRTIGYALSNSTAGVTDSLSAEEVAPGQIRITSNLGTAQVALPQLGRFNVSNALGVLGCLLARGIPFERAAALLAQLPAVPGRMQKLGDAPLVVVDYAHTPDALDKTLQALRPIAAARGGRLAVVFGAGGNRDAAKRPAMGRVASRLADRVVLTSDNPRHEDPSAIIAAIRAGVDGSCVVEADRARAIESTIAGATAADVVLIAGKGHEDYQEVAGKRHPFSDAAVAHAALARRSAA
jgi:UDP-N-acetylmuramoyl-L-alanyl-D-glutamate--2,6-diaminopimelate ligase